MSAREWSSRPQSGNWAGFADSLPAAEQLARSAHPGSRLRRGRRPRAGWHAYRPSIAVDLPAWTVEVTLTIEHPVGPSEHRSAEPQALLLLRSTSAVESIALGIADAVAELESLAGVRQREPRLHLVRSRPEPGLAPLTRLTTLGHLRRASCRGLAPSRRRAAARLDTTWDAGGGAVLTCHGPAGLSAQSVIWLHGRGDPRWLQLPAGGGMVVRAWRLERPADSGVGRLALTHPRPGTGGWPGVTWALASGLVLASSRAGGLGRASGRLAAAIRTGGWDASVLTGPAALQLARAGDPCQPVPRLAACWATTDEVEAMLDLCLAAARRRAPHADAVQTPVQRGSPSSPTTFAEP
jgi:hypothetical protein